MRDIKGHSFPQASGFSIGGVSIEDHLHEISPTIKITSINTSAISLDTFKSIVNALTNSANFNSGSNSNNLNDSQVDAYLSTIDDSLKINSTSDNLPHSINLFFNTITHYSEDVIDLVITSSPQIKVDLTKGWKSNQSIFNFLKEMLGNNPFSTLFGKIGENITKVFSSATNYVQSAMQMTGRDIQLGPYWSFSNSPLSNYPEFSMETVLINDCWDHYKDNRDIVQLLTMDYLPTTEDESEFRFKPPYLFNIEIGVDFGFKKKMYFCKATFNVTETGKYFLIEGEKVPEFFKVSCHFTSLLPDIQNLSEGFEYSENKSGEIEYIGPKVESKIDEKPVEIKSSFLNGGNAIGAQTITVPNHKSNPEEAQHTIQNSPFLTGGR